MRFEPSGHGKDATVPGCFEAQSPGLSGFVHKQTTNRWFELRLKVATMAFVHSASMVLSV
jgi:hypothetical protein